MIDGGGVGGGESHFLPLSGFMVLKPVKDIFAFNLAIVSKPSRDLLNLFSSWGPNSIVVVKIDSLTKLQSLKCVCCHDLWESVNTEKLVNLRELWITNLSSTLFRSCV
ncbi:hypothetical protein Q3G72_002427 [Acer saccharum]|nr:hypothetical protein Q3G72_002427 [Acer saccharum]